MPGNDAELVAGVPAGLPKVPAAGWALGREKGDSPIQGDLVLRTVGVWLALLVIDVHFW